VKEYAVVGIAIALVKKPEFMPVFIYQPKLYDSRLYATRRTVSRLTRIDWNRIFRIHFVAFLDLLLNMQFSK